MRFPRFAENGSNPGRAGLGDLDENALVFVGDHAAWLVILYCYLLLSHSGWTTKMKPETSTPLLN